jgi:hypothetical protein
MGKTISMDRSEKELSAISIWFTHDIFLFFKLSCICIFVLFKYIFPLLLKTDFHLQLHILYTVLSTYLLT